MASSREKDRDLMGLLRVHGFIFPEILIDRCFT